MDTKDFYFLGKITKTSGYKGNLVFFFDVDDIKRYSDIEAVFVMIGMELIPYVIKSISVKSANTAIVNLEDINSEDEAQILAGNDIYLPLSFLPPLTGNKFYYHEVYGFSVVDINKGNIGTIEYVMDQGSQALFIIKNKEKEILIPIVNNIIRKIDRKSKKILVEAPEGLIDIYI